MGQISASHTAGLDLIDKLFFNQILVHCLFTEELLWLKNLDSDLDRELTHKGVTGVQRQVVRHGVLCMMEAGLSESLLLLREVYPDQLPALPDHIPSELNEQTERFHVEYFQAMLLAILNKIHLCDQLVVIDITNVLLGKYEKAPATVRYRLVERMFSYEFSDAPIDCFTWLAQMSVLDSSKHPGRALEALYSTEPPSAIPPPFLQRLALLCELDMQRDHARRIIEKGYDRTRLKMADRPETGNLPPKTKSLIHAQIDKDMVVNRDRSLKHSFPIVNLTELENPASIQYFFSQLNTYAIRFRAFQGSLASWIGMLCGGYVEILDRDHDRKVPIFSVVENKKKTGPTVTQQISELMSARGFEVTDRTIYERHRDFKETILKTVTTYHDMKLIENVAFPPTMNDLTYDNLTPVFSQLMPKPRRRPR